MKKQKKIRLEDLKIQSFSTTQHLSKDQTNKIVGGTEESGACWQTNHCYTSPTPYGACEVDNTATNWTICGSCPQNTCTYTVGAACGTGSYLDCTVGCTGPYC